MTAHNIRCLVDRLKLIEYYTKDDEDRGLFFRDQFVSLRPIDIFKRLIEKNDHIRWINDLRSIAAGLGERAEKELSSNLEEINWHVERADHVRLLTFQKRIDLTDQEWEQLSHAVALTHENEYELSEENPFEHGFDALYYAWFAQISILEKILRAHGIDTR